MAYTAQPHRPFPASMEGGSDGAFFERVIEDGAASFYLIVHPRRYLTARDQSLIDQGQLSLEELHPEVARLGRPPAPGTLWLYELEAFEVLRIHHGDQESFNDNATAYRSAVFDDVQALLAYCQQEFGVSASDFRKRDATNYPEF